MLRRLVRRALGRAKSEAMDPAAGYDLWSSAYDDEKHNLVIDLDEALFGELLRHVPIEGNVVVDVGCGTGRHWHRLLARRPAELLGYDVSAGMLARLRVKYPLAMVHQSGADALSHTRDGGCDVIVSTLALSHVERLEQAFAEWARVLRVGGHVLVTDFHPAAAAQGDTSFRYGRRRVQIKIHVRSIPTLKAAAAAVGLAALSLEETIVGPSMRSYYEQAGMVRVFDRMEGVPILYGLHFRKLGGVSE